MNRTEKILKVIILVLITMLLTFLATIAYVNKTYDKQAETANYSLMNTGLDNFPKLKSVYNLISKNYYKEIDKEKVENAAIQGMLQGLEDPYTYYMDTAEYEDFSMETSGTYEGIGLYICKDVEKDLIQVITPIKGSPAYEAGLETGDYIIAVNGVKYSGSELQEATNNMRGPENTKVTVTVLRGEKTFDKELTRRSIDIPTLDYEVLDGNIGYIEIVTFDEDIATDFAKAMEDLTSKKVKGIIIDVRDNPGGYLDQVVEIADMLLPEGIIVYTVDRDGNREDYESDANKIDIPIAILTNESSASASEILASALQDHGVAKVVGTTTYGKGLVQKVYNVGLGEAVKLTTSEYFTPNGNKINGIGVTPDVIVEEDDNSKTDVQLEKAKELFK